jgi:hypothetical protein
VVNFGDGSFKMADKDLQKKMEADLKSLKKEQNVTWWKKHLTFKEPVNFNIMKVLKPRTWGCPHMETEGIRHAPKHMGNHGCFEKGTK